MIIQCPILLQQVMFILSIERVWKPNHAKPAQANGTIILRGHISTKVRIPALCRKARANNLPCVHVAQRTEWCWRSSPQRPLWNNSGCLVAVCMRSVSNSWHSSQMFKPPLHPPPHSSPLTERAGGQEEIEVCFARAFLNILLCSLFATPSFKITKPNTFLNAKLAWWSISPHWENGSIQSLFMFLSLSQRLF